MSNTVDQKVVEMKFDNRQFETNVQASMSTIDKLKQSLNFNGATKGLENVSSSIKSFDMSAITNAIENISSKFTTFGMIGVTALQNITNSAINAGKKIISALTIDPIKAGFSEYETQMNAVQTIMANTQSRQKMVTNDAVASIKQTSDEALASTKSSNSASLNNLKDTHKQKLKEYEKQSKSEIKVVENKYKEESDALDDAIDKETEDLKNAHKQKLALYEEEYMQKLKVIDEERYNRIKAIDNEINAINGKTKAEEKVLKAKEQSERIDDLRKAVSTAKNTDDRLEAEKRLSDYQDEIAREKLLEERDIRIEKLEGRKDSINNEYDLAQENLQNEYAAKKDAENELYDVETKNLKDNQQLREEVLRETYQVDKELLQEKVQAEKEAIQEIQNEEMESLRARNDAAIQYIKDQKEAVSQEPVEFETTKGSTLEDVNKALDELNKYADQTIYNFTEMTRNVGTFTAAGVDLDTSVQAIKGIANLAAVSGSSSQQASSAMYQLSQALSTGTVRLMDWNSVVNAGMGGQVFQDALTETARVHGIAIDQMISSEGSFRGTLEKGWLSSEILTETLSKFTGDLNTEQLKTMGYTDEQVASIIKLGQNANDAATKVKTFTQLFDTLKEAAQSGWTNTWEIIVGDFEEAKTLLTEASKIFGDIIGKSADARNGLLQGWKDLGGRLSLIEAARNTLNGILSIIAPIKQAFTEIFPPIKAKQLFGFTEGLKTLLSHLKLSDEASGNLKRTFKGLFAIFDIAKTIIEAVFNAIKPLLGGVDDLGSGILRITASIGDWLVKLDEFIKKSDIFNTIFQTIVDIIRVVIDVLQALKNKAVELFKKLSPGFEIIHGVLQRIHERMSQIGDAAGSMQFGVITAVNAIGKALSNSKFLQLMSAIWDLIKGVGSGIAKVLGQLTSGLIDKVKNVNFDSVLDFINTLAAGGLAIGISKFLKSVTSSFDGFKGMLKSITGILDGVRGCLSAYQEQLKAGTLLKIAIAIAILAGSILVISLIDSDKLAGAVAAITALFADLIGSMALLGKLGGGIKGAAKSVALLNGIAVAVLILSFALKNVAGLEPKQLAVGMAGIIGLTAAMIASAKILGSGGSTMTKGALQMVLFATAIKILASTCEDLAKLSWEQLAKGLTGVGILMGEISIFLRTAKFSGKAILTATGIVILAAAIKILASACKDFGEMKWEQLAKGMTSIGVLLTEIVAFTKLIGDPKKIFSTGIALIAIGAAMKIFASAISDMGDMSWEQLARGLSGMAGALLAITLALKFMPKNMIGIGIGLIAVSTALLILTSALTKMGSMTWEQIGKGLIVLGGAVGILAIGLNAMNGTLAGSAALLIAVAALAVLTPVLSILGAMSWETIVKGLVAMAGAFTVIGLAGLLLGPIVPAIIGIAGAFALIGVGVLALGVGLLAAGLGLTAIAAGFTALSIAGATGATAFVAALTVIVTGILSMAPLIVQKIAEAIVIFCKSIASSASVLGETIKVLVLTLLDVLKSCLPEILDTALYLLISLFTSLVDKAPTVIDLLFKFIVSLIDGVARNLPELTKSVVNLFMTLFTSVFEALKGVDTEVLIKGIAGVGLLAGIMAALAAVALITPVAMIGVLGMGAVIAELALMLAAIGALSKIPGLLWLVNEGAALMEGIGNALGAFIGGIVGGLMSGISSQFPQIGKDLSAFMTNAGPFIEGAGKISEATMNGVKALVEAILLLTGANVINGLTSWFTGGSSLANFGKELAAFGPYFSEYYESIKNIKGSVIQASANAAKALAEMTNNLPNTGGVVGWFSGESSLTAFAEELVAFGPKLKAYADSVDGLDAEVVVNSANAAKALSELANNLPNAGGVVGWFSGENSLSTFAEELVIFGPKLKEYASSIAYLDPNVVINSANAAKALSELATNLPNTGGVVGWFMGENDIGTFGESLELFGSKFANYADYMKDVKPAIVKASVNAAEAIIELQNGLPKKGGWFSDQTSLEDFGSDMASFGSQVGKYYTNVSKVDPTKLSNITIEINKMIAMFENMTKVSIDGATGFGEALKKVGETGLTTFTNAFTSATTTVTKSATDMLTTFIKGVESKKEATKKALVDIVENALTFVDKKKESFYSSASGLMSSFIDGFNRTKTVAAADIKEKHPISIALHNLVVWARNNLYTDTKYYDWYYDAGRHLINGYIEGVTSKAADVNDAVGTLGEDSVTALKKVLNEKSPSKITYGIGKYFGQGFINAVQDYSSMAYSASLELGDYAKRGLSSAIAKVSDIITNGIDNEPTIRPVLDLTDVKNGTGKLSQMMSGYSLSSSVTAANQLENSMSTPKVNVVDENTMTLETLKRAVKDLLETPSKVYENTFYINGENSDEIADKISHILQEQVARKDAAWA